MITDASSPNLARNGTSYKCRGQGRWVHDYRPLKLAAKTAESAVSGIATVGSFPGGKEVGAWR